MADPVQKVDESALPLGLQEDFLNQQALETEV
jgi:hypothetical protein